MELVHQRRLDIVEEFGAHKAWRVVRFAFQNSKNKKSVNFCLDGGSGLPVLQTRKPTDSTVSISAFSLGLKIVQISNHLKSKNALYYVVIMFVLSFCSIVFCFTLS